MAAAAAGRCCRCRRLFARSWRARPDRGACAWRIMITMIIVLFDLHLQRTTTTSHIRNTNLFRWSCGERRRGGVFFCCFSCFSVFSLEAENVFQQILFSATTPGRLIVRSIVFEKRLLIFSSCRPFQRISSSKFIQENNRTRFGNRRRIGFWLHVGRNMFRRLGWNSKEDNHRRLLDKTAVAPHWSVGIPHVIDDLLPYSRYVNSSFAL